MTAPSDIVRTPSNTELQHSRMAHYMRWLEAAGYGRFEDYPSLYQWSIARPGELWSSLWRWLGIVARRGADEVLADASMPGARWFPGARLSYAENLLFEALHGDPARVALYAVSETRPARAVTHGELCADVAACRAWLAAQGVGAGDRVAGVVAHGPEAIVAMLATNALGAIWSSASPDFGVNAIVDRFGQIEPKVLIGVNGYGYNGRVYGCGEAIDELAGRLNSLERIVVVDQLPDAQAPASAHTAWQDALAAHAGADIAFEPMAFDDPAFIVYSSGTTGAPKCIVHGGGGTLLQHAKELILHGDLARDDVLFYYTTTGWMMWNWQVSGLMTGAELVLFDGAPGYPDLHACWDVVAERRVTHFGTSAKFLGACRNHGLAPARRADLSSLRVIFSTGSPLLPEDFDWVRDCVNNRALLASISGGTDILSCFVGGCPLLPVRRGEIQCRMLGMDVQAWDDDGQAVINQQGELVCRQPVPSMPVMFWNDPGGERYRKAYFDTFDGVWAHGDCITITAEGGVIIHGRSDATLNPGGIRIGTAEIYRQVETMDAVADSIVVGQRWGEDERVVLLVVLNPGYSLDEGLLQRIRERIRAGASPRHVPARIAVVDAIPYTRNGKKVELAVARMLSGRDVPNRDALANPDSLDRIAAIESLFE